MNEKIILNQLNALLITRPLEKREFIEFPVYFKLIICNKKNVQIIEIIIIVLLTQLSRMH